MVGKLNHTERKIVERIALGYSDGAIARQLRSTVGSIKVQVGNAADKIEIPVDPDINRRVLIARWEWSQQLGLDVRTLKEKRC